MTGRVYRSICMIRQKEKAHCPRPDQAALRTTEAQTVAMAVALLHRSCTIKEWESREAGSAGR